MQPEPSLPQAQQAPVQQAPKKKFNYMIVVVVVLVLTIAGMGYWAYQLNTGWKATQAELAALQTKHETLTAERNELSSNLDATTAELEQTKTTLEETTAELETTKSDLAKAKNEITALEARIAKAWKYADVIRGIFVEDDTFLEGGIRVIATGDSTLKDKFDAFEETRAQAEWDDYLDYLMTTLLDLLK